ncbi:hypothetical protein [Aquimarina sp. 2201CG5-10]|uniref:hypothetical protein n=1 Tax=Aquimarina callyspongiae TaxID=3098150 RepID=UPI002AB3FB0E|nr:hypothetical protein [Aquimarina sp. 2201CG5-10]MDY8138593.1 hypothetical protein [Aquimarina sp. 2201CG5-10]
MKNNLLFNILIALIMVGCGVPQADYDKLKEENEKLKKEISECQLTPNQILDQANDYYDGLDYEKSKSRLIALVEKYPNSKEAKKGKKLLKKIEKEIIEAKKADDKDKLAAPNTPEYKRAISKMNKKYDVENEVTWYSDKSTSRQHNVNSFYTYIGKKDKRKPWLALVINHFSKKEWLFIQEIVIDADGKIFTLEEENPGEFKALAESGGTREWLDRVIKIEDLDLINAVASSKKTKIKFIGKEENDERIISRTEKKALKNVLTAFEILGGEVK